MTRYCAAAYRSQAVRPGARSPGAGDGLDRALMPGDGSDLFVIHRSRPWPFVGGVGNWTSCGRGIDPGVLDMKLLNVWRLPNWATRPPGWSGAWRGPSGGPVAGLVPVPVGVGWLVLPCCVCGCFGVGGCRRAGCVVVLWGGPPRGGSRGEASVEAGRSADPCRPRPWDRLKQCRLRTLRLGPFPGSRYAASRKVKCNKDSGAFAGSRSGSQTAGHRDK
jgi:hypothetical protein